jgi:hypothetical protein
VLAGVNPVYGLYASDRFIRQGGWRRHRPGNAEGAGRPVLRATIRRG